MASPYLIEPDEVEHLPAETFVRVMNHLVAMEARRLRIPLLNVSTSLRITDADGGVDARINDALTTNDWIPDSLTIWQYKSGHAPNRKTIEKEIEKPGVVEALRGGGTYIFTVQTGLSDTGRRSREQWIQEGVRRHSKKPRKWRL